jgi:hypothetical protein
MAASLLTERLYKETPPHLLATLPDQEALNEAALRAEIAEVKHLKHLCWITPTPNGYTLISQDEPKRSLGKGSYAKNVYAATLFSITRDTSLMLSLAAIIKISKTSFSPEPYHLLETVPQSPYLGGRPMGIFISERKEKYVYLLQKRLKGRRLSAQLQALENPKDQLSLFLQGMVHIAEGLKILHEHHLIHRDIKLDNATDTQLFDYDALCSEERPYRVKGARPELWPPELVIPFYQHMPTHPEVLLRYEELKIYYSEEFEELSKEVPPLPLVDGSLGFTFHPSFDIFIFGMQFVKIYGQPLGWSEEHPLFKIKSLIKDTLDFNPKKRPPIQFVLSELIKSF